MRTALKAEGVKIMDSKFPGLEFGIWVALAARQQQTAELQGIGAYWTPMTTASPITPSAFRG